MTEKTRAVTKEEKTEILQRLLNAWCETPELRLSQLLVNTFGNEDIFYLEDYPFIKSIEGEVKSQTR